MWTFGACEAAASRLIKFRTNPRKWMNFNVFQEMKKKIILLDFEESVPHSKTLPRIVSAKRFKLFCETNLKVNPSLVARANIKLMESKQRLVDTSDWFSIDYCLLENQLCYFSLNRTWYPSQRGWSLRIKTDVWEPEVYFYFMLETRYRFPSINRVTTWSNLRTFNIESNNLISHFPLVFPCSTPKTVD